MVGGNMLCRLPLGSWTPRDRTHTLCAKFNQIHGHKMAITSVPCVFRFNFLPHAAKSTHIHTHHTDRWNQRAWYSRFPIIRPSPCRSILYTLASTHARTLARVPVLKPPAAPHKDDNCDFARRRCVRTGYEGNGESLARLAFQTKSRTALNGCWLGWAGLLLRRSGSRWCLGAARLNFARECLGKTNFKV